jgi:hypothetical protein
MRRGGSRVNLAGMNRRASLPCVLAVLVACLVAATQARATVDSTVNWDVDLTAKETTRWSFSGSTPDSCSEYLGTTGYQAKGSGSQSLSVATTKKRRIWVETSRFGGKLSFLSFATDGWQIPATATKAGAASVMPSVRCEPGTDDIPPVPEIADASGCGTINGTDDPTLDWKAGKLTVDLRLGPSEPAKWLVHCPDIGEPKFFITEETTCRPKDVGKIALDQEKFTAPKPTKFTVRAKDHYVCPIPIDNANWHGGEASATVELSTSYEVTFIPRR